MIGVVAAVEVRLYRDAVARAVDEHPDLRLDGEAESARRAVQAVCTVPARMCC